MRAKRNGVYISFIVQDSNNRKEEIEDYFIDDAEDSSEEDSSEESHFTIAETRSHAKFLLVDDEKLVLGSFNALENTQEETDDTSLLIEGSVQQLWPYVMRIYDIYTDLNEEAIMGVFSSTHSISRTRFGKRLYLHRTLSCGTNIHLLRTVSDHEEFFRLALPYNGHITIYSPFSTKDNAFKRLEFLQKLVPSEYNILLRTFPEFQADLNILLERFPDLKTHTYIEPTTSHQKTIILGDETIYIGSLNWLSAAQTQGASDDYGNLELSIVLQGPKAKEIIERFY